MLRLALSGLRHHWRSHVGLFLGATVATAIVVGALAVGDSVRQSLREMALARLGNVHLALNGSSRFMRTQLADAMSQELGAPTTSVLMLRGTATIQRDDGERRSGQIQIVGVDESFWQLAALEDRQIPLAADSVAVNEPLARKLGLKPGEELLLRVEKPSLLSRDAPLSTVTDTSVPLRLAVSQVVPDRSGGRFSLAANQLPPLTAFVPIRKLQQAVGLDGRANTILVGGGETGNPTSSASTQALWKHWDFVDAGLELKPVQAGKKVELRTDRVFLDPPVGDAATQALPSHERVLTYFVNELRVGSRATPYSVVSGLEGGPVPADLRDNEVLINQWLADDLGAGPGDILRLSYWVVGPMRKLVTETAEFRIRAVVPLSGPALDPDLMPNIPGLSDKKDCREWEPGVPIDLEKIRDKDQDYWSKYRGTPKAFLTLAAAQKAWHNRFGNLTAVRYPADEGGSGRAETCIRQALNPASLGIYFAPVREQALIASSTALDFGQLFIGFSFFLIIAALLLTSLLFGFAVEQRSEEVGTLLALGFTPSAVRRLLVLEAIGPLTMAALAGALLGMLYTKAIVYGLNTVWSGAVAGAGLVYAAEPATLLKGAVAGFFTALFTVWLAMRRQARTSVRELLSAGSETELRVTQAPAGKKRAVPGLVSAVVLLVLGLGALAASLGKNENETAGYFFAGGFLLLIAGIAGCRALLALMLKRVSRADLTIASLGARGTARRVGRSLAAVALLASGSFLVVAVGASRHDASADADRRDSGTGGFAFYGEATLPVHSDLNSEGGREDYTLDSEELAEARIVQMRLREGDDASCLNLNRAQAPRLLGVQPEELRSRKAFKFAQVNKDHASDPWSALVARATGDGPIPAIGDMNTVVWSLGKGLGDTLPYVDERGNTVQLRIVGIMGNSVLQGALLIHEADFVKLFPTISGYQAFLIDAPRNSAEGVREELSRGLEDQGLDLTPAAERLAAFNAVEETYLSIFGALGGLGLLLGSAGLGVIVLRNVLERRGELALMRAVGFQREALHRLIVSEHALLLVLGLSVGVAAAAAAVTPTIRSVGTAPVVSVAGTLVLVLISGFVWTWLATAAALRGPLLSALRNE